MQPKNFILEKQLHHLFIHKILCLGQSTIKTEVYGYLRTKFEPLGLLLGNNFDNIMYEHLHYSLHEEVLSDF